MNIKFRAWDNQNNKFFEPTYKAYENQIQELFLSPNGRLVMRTYTEIIDQSLFEGRFNIMQCTGLLDKNGKEIFEGDVLKGTCSTNTNYLCEGLQEKLGQEIIGFIQYSYFYAQFYFTIDDVTFLTLNKGLVDFEVIGNIYENAELLNN